MAARLTPLRMARVLRTLIVFCTIVLILLLSQLNITSITDNDKHALSLKVEKHFARAVNLTLINSTRAVNLTLVNSTSAVNLTLVNSTSAVNLTLVKSTNAPQRQGVTHLRISERTQLLKDLFKCQDETLVRETLQHDNYWVLRNFMRGSVSTSIGCAESVTFTVAGDYRVFASLPELVTRWQAPISFAVYAPGYDFGWTMDALQYTRHCLSESELIRKFVTFHVFFPMEHMPSLVPRSEIEIEKWAYSCRVKIPPFKYEDKSFVYRKRMQLGHPLNVGRNIARRLANTHYMLTANMALLPSENLAEQFLDMLARSGQAVSLVEGDAAKRARVYAVPAFEVTTNGTLPQTQAELVPMLGTEMAHELRLQNCKDCSVASDYGNLFHGTADKQITVSDVTTPEDNERAWELYFFSDSRVPLYDERFTWEGPSAKRFQGYAMCLLRFEYHLLFPAFLAYRTGTNLYDKDMLQPGVDEFMISVIRREIRPQYNTIYGYNPECLI